MFPTTGVLDYFRDSSAPRTLPTYSPNWATLTLAGGDTSTIAGGGCGLDSGADYWTPLSLTDFEVWMDVRTGPGSGGLNVFGRITSPASPNGYFARANGDTSWNIVQITAGANTTLLTGSLGAAPQIGDALGLSGIGSFLTMWYRFGSNPWTILGSVYDSTWAGPGNIGLRMTGAAPSCNVFGGGIPIVAAQGLLPVPVAAVGGQL